MASSQHKDVIKDQKCPGCDEFSSGSTFYHNQDRIHLPIATQYSPTIQLLLINKRMNYYLIAVVTVVAKKR